MKFAVLLCVVAGICLAAWGVYLLQPTVGLLAGGAGLVVFGLLVDDGDD